MTTMNTKTITSTLEDAEGNTSEIEIIYDYHDYMGWKPEIVVTGYVYEWLGEKLHIPVRELLEDVQDIIRVEERQTVTFNL